MTPRDPREADAIIKLRGLHAELGLAGDLQQELYSPENELIPLLVSLLREDPGESTPVPPPTWARLIRLLAPHGILPLLHQRVVQSGTGIPMWAEEHLRAAYLSSRVHTFRQESELRDLLGAMASAGVEPLLLKGPALGRSLYPDPVFRPSGDIDLLVRREQVPAARKALLSLGFHLTVDNFGTSPGFYIEETYLPDGCPWPFPVEIHWDIQQYGRRHREAALEELFDHAVRVATPALSFSTLSPVHALVLAGIHVAMHHADEVRLIWVQDAALLAGTLDGQGWQDLRRECQRWEATIPVERILSMASLWFGTPQGSGWREDWPRPTATEQATYDGVLHDLRRIRTFLALRWPGDAPLAEKLRLIRRLVVDPMGMGAGDRSLSHRVRGIRATIRRWAGVLGRW
jgi:hypothetical protein